MIQNLRILNEIYKKTNAIYRDAAKRFGVPECTFWILYTLRETGRPVTQSEIRDITQSPSQTINSALKKLEADGMVRLENQNDRRKKQIILTEKGVSFAERTADQMIAMETKAMQSLSDEEQSRMLDVMRRYAEALDKEVRGVHKKGN